MNIHHIKYFIALAKRSNYREAAAFCNVSQPAMSMAIKKFEEKLGQKLFKRQKSPVTLSPFGKKILPYAQKIVHEFDSMLSVSDDNEELSGSVRLGVIPTVAPYLIPRFIGKFLDQYPLVKLEIEELTTKNIIDKIKNDEIDVGILATPVEKMILEANPLYYEEFYAYSATAGNKQYILPKDIDLQKLWLLQEGHCLRSQVINLCELKGDVNPGILYNAGSVETLINLVDNYGGITIVPELATKNLSKSRREKLQLFEPPTPVREISIVYHKYTIKKPIIDKLTFLIKSTMPKYMKEKYEINNLKIDLA